MLTISTRVSSGEAEDVSGPALADALRTAGAEVVTMQSLPDDAAAIEQALRGLTDRGAEVDLIFTTGGTGLTPDDVTPEATRSLIERDVPGIAEAMRAESLRHTPMGVLSRGVAGIVGRTLIVNFPGNAKAIAQLFPVVAPTLEHAVNTLQREHGRSTRH